MPKLAGRPGRSFITPSMPFHRPSRLLGTIVVLGLALVVTGVLAYEAQSSSRGHRETAERTLRDYASFAGWQFVQQAKNGLQTTVIASLFEPAKRVDPDSLPKSLLPPPSVQRSGG